MSLKPKHDVAEILQKKCPKCKKILKINSFAKNKGKKDGLHSWCRRCNTIDTKRYMNVLRKKAKMFDKISKWCDNYPNTSFSKWWRSQNE